MNFTALRLAAHRLSYEGVPIALQGRIFGSKGVWILHPSDHSIDSPPRIWIRDSQRKINLVDPSLLHYGCPQDPDVLRDVHPAHFIFDLVARSPPQAGQTEATEQLAARRQMEKIGFLVYTD